MVIFVLFILHGAALSWGKNSPTICRYNEPYYNIYIYFRYDSRIFGGPQLNQPSEEQCPDRWRETSGAWDLL